jgi:hypothetical protein
MASNDPRVVKDFKVFGMERIQTLLAETGEGFVDKQATYDQVVREFKERFGWPAELTRLEPTNRGRESEVYINRLHWMTANLCSQGITESVSKRPFIALAGQLDAPWRP